MHVSISLFMCVSIWWRSKEPTQLPFLKHHQPWVSSPLETGSKVDDRKGPRIVYCCLPRMSSPSAMHCTVWVLGFSSGSCACKTNTLLPAWSPQPWHLEFEVWKSNTNWSKHDIMERPKSRLANPGAAWTYSLMYPKSWPEAGIHLHSHRHTLEC